MFSILTWATSASCFKWSIRSGRKIIGWFGLIFSITGPVAAVILFPVSFHILQVICGSLLNIIFSIILIVAMEKENISLLWMWIYYRQTTIILNTLVYIILNFYYIQASSFPYIVMFDISYIVSQLFNVYCIIVVKAFVQEIDIKSQSPSSEFLLKKGQLLSNNNNIILV